MYIYILELNAHVRNLCYLKQYLHLLSVENTIEHFNKYNHSNNIMFLFMNELKRFKCC